MPSPETSRVNLARGRNPWTDRSPEESTLIWRLTLQWWIGGRDGRRNPRTQRAWTQQVGVAIGERLSQPYVAKMVRRLKRDWLDMADTWRDQPKATLEDLRRLAELRKVVSEPQPVAVPHPDRTTQPPQQNAGIRPCRIWTQERERVDDLLRMWAGINPNRSKGWFDDW